MAINSAIQLAIPEESRTGWDKQIDLVILASLEFWADDVAMTYSIGYMLVRNWPSGSGGSWGNINPSDYLFQRMPR